MIIKFVISISISISVSVSITIILPSAADMPYSVHRSAV